MILAVLAFVINGWQQNVDNLPGPEWWWYYLGDETFEGKMDKEQLDEKVTAWEKRMDKKKAEEEADAKRLQEKLIRNYLEKTGRNVK